MICHKGKIEYLTILKGLFWRASKVCHMRKKIHGQPICHVIPDWALAQKIGKKFYYIKGLFWRLPKCATWAKKFLPTNMPCHPRLGLSPKNWKKKSRAGPSSYVFIYPTYLYKKIMISYYHIVCFFFYCFNSHKNFKF